MRSFRNQVKFHWLDYRKSVYIFWAILLLVGIAQLVIHQFWPNAIDSPIDYGFTVNYGAIAIFTLVSGLLTASQTFPLMMSFGFTRRQFYSNVIISFVVYCAGMSLMQNIVVYGGREIFTLFGYQLEHNIMSFFPLWYTQFAIYLAISFLFFVMGNVFYRFGVIPGLIVIALYILAANLITDIPESNFETYFSYSASIIDLNPANIALIVAIIAAVVGWLLCRRAAVRNH